MNVIKKPVSEANSAVIAEATFRVAKRYGVSNTVATTRFSGDIREYIHVLHDHDTVSWETDEPVEMPDVE